MRTVIQRVSEACVRVPAEGYESSIGHGLLLLVAFIDEDMEEDLDWTARKIAAMRIFMGRTTHHTYRLAESYTC